MYDTRVKSTDDSESGVTCERSRVSVKIELFRERSYFARSINVCIIYTIIKNRDTIFQFGENILHVFAQYICRLNLLYSENSFKIR